MTIPPMCEIKTFDQIKTEMVALYQTIVPEYTPNESDTVMPVLETFAYRELLLRTYFNAQISGSFWQSATDSNLDFIAAFFGITRLVGSKPTATVRFTINTVLGADYTIESGMELLNADGSVSMLISDVTIPKGSTTAEGTAELQIYASSSDTVVMSTMIPKPYLSGVEQLNAYSGGSDSESDASVRNRIELAFDAQTTAGSVGGYTVHALGADARISDVNIVSPSAGIVDVVIHSDNGVDMAMIDRVYSALNSDTVRPLTDTVNVMAATLVPYSIKAYILVSGSDAETILSTAKTRLYERLSGAKIGKSITIGSIIAALSVEGVEDVTVVSPSVTVSVGDYQIALNTDTEVGVA